ncbi:Conserved_hypothetical protein [Hexamita inflata]|uniref:Uncharacterized protein n=1 Tax=Hexamita inflata TaxID=28002 RepID=A0AA86PTJ0_9EUKA|nr:Conserved hypothetical protein [Hexamita inflata]
MDTIIQYFTDPLLNSDAERQARSIICFTELRQNKPALITEIQDITNLLQTIIKNLQNNYAVQSEPVQQFLDEFLSDFQIEPTPLLITDLKIELTENQKPILLVEPLIELFWMLIGKGIFYESQADLTYIPKIQDLIQSYSQLFLQVLPQILKLNTTDKVGLVKTLLDSIAILSACTQIDIDLNEFTHQEQCFNGEIIYKRVERDLIIPYIQQQCLPILKQVFDISKELTEEADIPLKEDIELTVLYFVNGLMEAMNININDILDQVIYFINYPAVSRHAILSLAILQQVNWKKAKFDVKAFAAVAQNSIFNSGGLQVKSVPTVEYQLAILNIIEQITRMHPQVMNFLSADSDVQLKEETTADNKIKTQLLCNQTVGLKTKNITIQGDRIIDSATDSDEEPVKPKSPPKSPQINKYAIDDVDSEDFTSTKPVEQPLTSVALAQPEIPVRKANFVNDFLIQLFKDYGNNQYHSSRVLQKCLMEVKQEPGILRQNVNEGHSVNYIELNKTRVAKMDEKMKTYTSIVEEQQATLKQKTEKIKLAGESVQTYNKLTKLNQVAEAKMKTLHKELKNDIRKDQIFSHAQASIVDQDYKKTLIVDKHNLKTTQQALSVIDYKYESLFVHFSLRILCNIFSACKSSPSRQIRFVLQEINQKFIEGTIYFIDKLQLTQPALELIYSILTFPHLLSNNAEQDQWHQFFENGLLDQINRVNYQKQIHGAVFITRLFGENWQKLIPYEKLELLVESLLDSFVYLVDALFESSTQLFIASFSSLTILICAYANKCGTILKKASKNTISKLNNRLIDIFRHERHHQLYTACLLTYGLYGLPKNQFAARFCYDSGVFKQMCEHFVNHFNSESQIQKLQPADIIMIRTFSEIAQHADKQLKEYTQSRSDLQKAICRVYQLWQRSVQMRCYDQYSGVILPDSQLARNDDVVPRGDIFEIKGTSVQRPLSPVQNHEEAPRSVLSPVRSRFNQVSMADSIMKGDYTVTQPTVSAAEINTNVAPQSHFNLPQESKYLLKLNLTATTLAFFRSLYPDLANHQGTPNPTLDVSKLPKTGRIELRPASGQTPVIGKLPALLPNLNKCSGVESKKTEVTVVMEKQDAMILMQMQAQGIKESITQLQYALEGDIVEDDRAFINEALRYMDERIRILITAGDIIYNQERIEKVEIEAQFYQWQKV